MPRAGAAPVPLAFAESSTEAGTHAALTLAENRLLRVAGSRDTPISDVSAYCLECHEEMADESEERPAAHPAGGPGANHPVDVPYPEAARDYRAPGELPREALLLEGRVTCVSCHAHDDPEHGLVLPAEGSELCRACHRN